MEVLESFWNFLINLDYSGIPIAKIAIVVLILIVGQTFRQFFVLRIIRIIERFTSQTETDLDDQLIAIAKPAISWLVVVAQFWLIATIMAEELGSLYEKVGRIINLSIVLIIGYVVYRSASILGDLIAQWFLHTESDLDDLVKPLMPKVFQSAAIIIIAIKIGEMFLGQSAAALAGLFGGAGITLGLLLKDIFYDWFCTVIIYSDRLYREGDWVGIAGVNGFVQIMSIGFRTTTLHITNWGSIVKMPNSKMIGGIVENWSQNPGDELIWGLVLKLKIDNISAKQTARICAALQELPKSIAGLKDSCTVRFVNMEMNARVLEIKAKVNDANLYFEAEKNLNLAILELLEQEGIDFLHVRLETSPDKFQQLDRAANN